MGNRGGSRQGKHFPALRSQSLLEVSRESGGEGLGTVVPELKILPPASSTLGPAWPRVTQKVHGTLARELMRQAKTMPGGAEGPFPSGVYWQERGTMGVWVEHCWGSYAQLLGRVSSFRT